MNVVAKKTMEGIFSSINSGKNTLKHTPIKGEPPNKNIINFNELKMKKSSLTPLHHQLIKFQILMINMYM